MLLRLGGGDDRFSLENVVARDDIDIDAGTGRDSGSMRSTQVIDDLLARMGDGSDSLELDYAYADAMILLGEDQNDLLPTGGVSGDGLAITKNVWVNSPHQSGWEWINGRPVSKLF